MKRWFRIDAMIPEMMDKSSSDPVRVLDLSRLCSRAGRSVMTGIDRVEAAYLKAFLAESEPVFALINVSSRYYLLAPDQVRLLAEQLSGSSGFGKADVRSLLHFRQPAAMKRMESDLRRNCLARCDPGGLAAMLKTHLPPGADFYSVGHTNLNKTTAQTITRGPDWKYYVLVHDVIPLEYPGYQRRGSAEKFRAKMEVVSEYADRVIYNSRATKVAAEQVYADMGRVPNGVVAHLGLDLPEPDACRTPTEIPRNRDYFICPGTIEPRKNHALLLKVWHELSADHSQAPPLLVIAGTRGWANEDVFRQLDNPGPLKDHILELSDLSDHELSAAICGAKAVLFPSRAEGFGLPVAEAIMLGAPVICSNLPVYREYLDNLPVYLDANDSYRWTQAIRAELKNNRAEKNTGNAVKLPTWKEHFNLVLNQ